MPFYPHFDEVPASMVIGKKCSLCNEEIRINERAVKFGIRGEQIVHRNCLELGIGRREISLCSHCNYWLFTGELEVSTNGDQFCVQCIEALHLIRCAECGNIFQNTIGREYCYNCYPFQVHDYSYKPKPKFFHLENEKTNLYYGIELEIDQEIPCCDEDDDEEDYELREKAEENLENIKNKLPLSRREIYLKNDSSLSDYGVEIVTHPLSYQYFLKKFPIREICNIAKENGFKSHDTNTCGLHVHISKKYFGEYGEYDSHENEANIGKFILFFESHWEELVKFSRRTKSSLRRWADKYAIREIEEEKDETKICKIVKGISGRYFAVNLSNKHTVEVRIFKGSLRPETITATIQLLQVILSFIKKNSLEKVRSASFKKLVTQNKRKYQELFNYCKERGII